MAVRSAFVAPAALWLASIDKRPPNTMNVDAADQTAELPVGPLICGSGERHALDR
jgi:hypothetical protein